MCARRVGRAAAQRRRDVDCAWLWRERYIACALGAVVACGVGKQRRLELIGVADQLEDVELVGAQHGIRKVRWLLLLLLGVRELRVQRIECALQRIQVRVHRRRVQRRARCHVLTIFSTMSAYGRFPRQPAEYESQSREASLERGIGDGWRAAIDDDVVDEEENGAPYHDEVDAKLSAMDSAIATEAAATLGTAFTMGEEMQFGDDHVVSQILKMPHHMPSECEDLFKNLRRCLELREKYMDASLQGNLFDNPKNWDAEYCEEWSRASGVSLPVIDEHVEDGALKVDGCAWDDEAERPKPWKVYPAPPRPHWEHFTPAPASSFVRPDAGGAAGASSPGGGPARARSRASSSSDADASYRDTLGSSSSSSTSPGAGPARANSRACSLSTALGFLGPRPLRLRVFFSRSSGAGRAAACWWSSASSRSRFRDADEGLGLSPARWSLGARFALGAGASLRAGAPSLGRGASSLGAGVSSASGASGARGSSAGFSVFFGRRRTLSSTSRPGHAARTRSS